MALEHDLGQGRALAWGHGAVCPVEGVPVRCTGGDELGRSLQLKLCPQRRSLGKGVETSTLGGLFGGSGAVFPPGIVEPLLHHPGNDLRGAAGRMRPSLLPSSLLLECLHAFGGAGWREQRELWGRMVVPWGAWVGHDPKTHPGSGNMDGPNCVWAGGMATEAHPCPALWEQGMCTPAPCSFPMPVLGTTAAVSPGRQGMKPGGIPNSGNEALGRVSPSSIPFAGSGGREAGHWGCR